MSTNALSLNVMSNFNVNLSLEDLINIEAVKYEKSLREKRNELRKLIDDNDRKMAQAQKEAHNFAIKYLSAKKGINKIKDQLNDIIKLANSSTVGKEKSNCKIIEQIIFQRNARIKQDNTTEYYYSVWFDKLPFIFGFKSIKEIEDRYKVVDKIGEENKGLRNELRLVDVDISQIGFKVKEIRAEVTQSIINNDDKTKDLLKLTANNQNE